MILNSSAHKSHYDILGVKEDASYEDIRTVYRSAILTFHPDKLHDNSSSSEPSHHSKHEVTKNAFLDIQKAWEILSDQRSRAAYDIELCAMRQDAATAEDVGFDDLKIEASGGDDDGVFALSYPCRCGDFYVIDSLDLTNMGYPLVKGRREMFIETSKDLPVSVVLPCGSCSLKVRLLINQDTTRLASSSG
ncbi:hypothetical protein DM860_012222 [Cuscuta australis]|uniref:J domain-containing protein n=1 Tax=Cuscuta australis TaxID=267555 RepID=A0A328E6U6_9ASTE|nr:hypothetical protein DM860_012222 [Cuscuta australis]